MERWSEAVRDEILALIAGSPPSSKFLLPWDSVTRFWTSATARGNVATRL